ncbi:unnamed protein product [Rotaria sp. Silwood2]|nr:unnamed protein product [Rotaria sp. Silwood2]
MERFLDLVYNERTFNIRIDPSHLKEDQLHFTELQAFHTKQINVEPLLLIDILYQLVFNGKDYIISRNLASSDNECTLSNELHIAVSNVVIKIACDKDNLEQFDKIYSAFEKPKTTKDTK